jgi:hypothetical protein
MKAAPPVHTGGCFRSSPSRSILIRGRIRRAFIHFRLPVRFRYVLGLQIARAYALVFMILVEPITGQIEFRNESWGRRLFFSSRGENIFRRR